MLFAIAIIASRENVVEVREFYERETRSAINIAKENKKEKMKTLKRKVTLLLVAL
jgi:hypothetical protein